MASAALAFPPADEAQWWKAIEGARWTCTACVGQQAKFKRSDAVRHCGTATHQRAIAHWKQKLNAPQAGASSETPPRTMHVGTSSAIDLLFDDSEVPDPSHAGEGSFLSSNETQIEPGYNFMAAYLSAFSGLPRSDATQYLAQVGGAAIFTQEVDDDEGDVLSDDEDVERSQIDESDSEHLAHSDNGPEDNGNSLISVPVDTTRTASEAGNTANKRIRITPEPKAPSSDWYPWDDRVACSIDILMHLPRSVFSQRQLDIFLWVLNVNGVRDTPSVQTLQDGQAKLHSKCGIRTLSYKGALGHAYSVNSLADIISQEMANPRVRPDLHFFPEDAGGRVDEYWHASHWREEADLDKITPMVAVHNQHFYAFEPCLLRSGNACMPFRFFERGQQLYADTWRLAPHRTPSGELAWLVVRRERTTIPVSEFLVGFDTWSASGSTAGLPSATAIAGCLDNPSTNDISAWGITLPALGNRWRVAARGARVCAFPIWLYCDDTSGNVSKKWNKHNSFLFTPAGLPSNRVHEEYNVHFLCTSNIAPPLEMLDGIVEQLEEAWTSGIWAYDCILKERVLVIPSVVALLGDNTMQSELSGHVGLTGHRFCRACDVTAEQQQGGDDESSHGDTDMADGDVHDNTDTGAPIGGAAATTEKGKGKEKEQAPANATMPEKEKEKKKKGAESATDMLTRVRNFIGRPRRKQETVENLKTMFALGSENGNQDRISKMKTALGLKDNFLEHFLKRFAEAAKGKKGAAARQKALDDYRATLPDDIQKLLSPVWRIPGLDPHSDTPVEVLHVVLLGFVKYLWRDVIKHQLKDNDAKKAQLATRLSDLDVSGLGISKLAGHTLVQYAGSLTGRDFRTIAQVAPFVLYDLVSAPCYAAWLALSRMIPLIWQSKISNIDAHLKTLEAEIKNFLAAMARWDPQWFNKPKFHILLHLLLHIRRFGPASLFATEGFESFNAVIRTHSVHSNRQCPSRDIGRAFAHGNRIRHLLSGGFMRFRDATIDEISRLVPDKTLIVDAGEAGLWYPVDELALAMVSTDQSDSVVASYLGMNNRQNAHIRYGRCKPDLLIERSYRETASGQMFPQLPGVTETELASAQWIVFSKQQPQVLLPTNTQPASTPTLGRVEEVVFWPPSGAAPGAQSVFVLIQAGDLLTNIAPYAMPEVKLNGQYFLVSIEFVLCGANLQHPYQTRASIQHQNPDQQILNTARMRDMNVMSALRSPLTFTDQDLDLAVQAGVTASVDRRKKTLTGSNPEKPADMVQPSTGDQSASSSAVITVAPKKRAPKKAKKPEQAASAPRV
ncbi:hypothetical protein EIP91_001135 [Steccherinum ochraceum]|uniref:Uncharacterized protein n=1 Tax=Steccherinum ochraceum TaxID=92696 RepID=A0A4R0RKZ4_9APHY|nr:hypothetical protein EIP91_001135 [Steccherinum ochraceum]